jgi:DegV family protein with EDD domain
MRLVTNPGSNLSPDAIERYGVELTAQTIQVDDDAHDTRERPTFADIDGWVARAKVHPYVVGTTAAEYIGLFRDIARTEREILTVTTSRRVIGSHDSANSAARAMLGRPEHAEMTIVVADSGLTDAGAGFATALAGEAMLAGESIDAIAERIDRYRKAALLRFLPDQLDYLVKGGRTNIFKRWLADWLGLRPLLGFVDGEAALLAKVSTSADRARALVDSALAGLKPGSQAWVAVMHGGGHAIQDAARCEWLARERLDVRYATVRPLSPSIYLHGGPAALALVVVPLEAIGWVDRPAPVL